MRVHYLLSGIAIFAVVLPVNAVSLPPSSIEIIVPARDYLGASSANVEAGGGLAVDYGPDTLHNAPPYGKASDIATWKFTAPRAGVYQLDVEYAALESRPIVINVNGFKVSSNGLSETTGGWDLSHQCWRHQAAVNLNKGANKVRFSRDDVFPHILTLRFTLNKVGYIGCKGGLVK